MIKVAFIGSYSKEWVGGVNYLSNLLYAISLLEEKKIVPIVFLGAKTDPAIIRKFSAYAEVVEDPIFDQKSIKWYFSKIGEKCFKSSFLINRLLTKHSVSVISHSGIIFNNKKIKQISWIPDFQHLHLPELFSAKELEQRNIYFEKQLRLSNTTIVSSYDAYNDCQEFSSQYIKKVRVLQFVSQASYSVAVDSSNKKQKVIESKYDFSGQFFFLPNQFWKHKNHMVVFEAVKLLKNKGINCTVLCSGIMHDHRQPEYIKEIRRFIKKNSLQENIKILGLIDYDDVFYLMRNALTVINPSLFEGWSSTVEECKSIGKNMILSDISVHKEQNPPESLYFDPHDAQSLSMILNEVWIKGRESTNEKINVAYERIELKKRTLVFAKKYQTIVMEVVNI